MIVLALLLACVAATLPWLRPGLPVPPERQSYLRAHSTPVTAAEKLCDLPGRTATFAEIGFASYLEWACPSAGVMIDTRFELYAADLWHDYLRVSAAQFGWEDALSRNGAAVVLAGKKEQAELVAALRVSPAWRTVYEDDDALLAERR